VAKSGIIGYAAKPQSRGNILTERILNKFCALIVVAKAKLIAKGRREDMGFAPDEVLAKILYAAIAPIGSSIEKFT